MYIAVRVIPHLVVAHLHEKITRGTLPIVLRHVGSCIVVRVSRLRLASGGRFSFAMLLPLRLPHVNSRCNAAHLTSWQRFQLLDGRPTLGLGRVILLPVSAVAVFVFRATPLADYLVLS